MTFPSFTSTRINPSFSNGFSWNFNQTCSTCLSHKLKNLVLIRRLTATLRALFYGDVELANFDNPRCFETIPVYFQIFESIPGWFQHYFWIMWMSKIYRYVFNDWKYTGTISHSWNRTGIFSKLDWLSGLWNHTGMISNNRNRSGTFSIFEIVPKNPSTWPVWPQCCPVLARCKPAISRQA